MKGPARRWGILIVGLVAGCALAGCRPPPTATATLATDPGKQPGPRTWSDSELCRLDALVTAEVVFPDPAQRKLFAVQPPGTEGHTRGYGFELLPQPGMVKERHFMLVSVTFAHASLGRDTASDPVLSSTAGPNGSFLEALARTGDGAYDVRVSLAMLLPEGVRLAAFHPRETLARVLRLYDTKGA